MVSKTDLDKKIKISATNPAARTRPTDVPLVAIRPSVQTDIKFTNPFLIPSFLFTIALFVPKMVRAVFFPLVLVPVLCGHKTASASTTGTAETIDCFKEMNEERKAAGLPEFTQASEETQVLPEHPGSGRAITASTLWTEICKKIAGDDGATTQANQLEGTFAYYSGKKDCKAAVQYWKDGFSLFKNELPPTFTALNDPPIYTDQAVSFVALYNPKASPVASCAFVTCTEGGAFAAADLSKSHEGRTLRRLQELETTATAVICLTNPKALTAGAAPFHCLDFQGRGVAEDCSCYSWY
ncbi:SAG family member [Eimeria necatrix]|uniref:SAG family member n=1 Tax=Eimeria necatrix TaxID=51315 RepID=U6N1E4_9EIME|nr:SAG family member [Eimeria necatrix]CDJ70313.1 SAG family member [Eimeria necatrix]